MNRFIAAALLSAVALSAQTHANLVQPSCPGNAPAVLTFQLTLDGFKTVPTCLELGDGLLMVNGKLTVQFPNVQPASYGRVDRFNLADFAPWPPSGSKDITVTLQAKPIQGTAVFAIFTGGIFVPIDIKPSDGSTSVIVTLDSPPPPGSQVVIMYWSSVAPPSLP